MKKFLLFSFLLLIGAYSSVAWGATENINGVTWTVDATGKITSCTGASGAVTIPNTVDGDTVRGFYHSFNFQNNTNITSIDFSQATYVHGLSVNFCRNATELTTVNFGLAITSISNYAFYGCSKLTSATLPDCVTSIGAAAFTGCPLTYIRIPADLTSIDMGKFSLSSVVTVDWNANLAVPTMAFDGNASLTTVNFGDNCNKAISGYAFRNCTSLQTVNFGNAHITSIGEHAFNGCRSLTSAILPDCVTSIGAAAFSNCTTLTHITIPADLTSITLTAFPLGNIVSVDWNANLDVPAQAFDGRTSLTTVNFGDNCNKAISNYAFRNCTHLSTVNFGNSQITSIGMYAFYGCTSLESAMLPNSVTSIGSLAFSSCPLKHIRIPASLSTVNLAVFPLENIVSIEWNANHAVPTMAFDGNTTLKTVNFGDNCNSAISGYAFRGCTNLQTVNFGNAHITSIGDHAFNGCTNLTSATLPDCVTSIGNLAFNGCNLSYIKIPAGLTSVNMNAFTGCNIVTVDWNANIDVPSSAFFGKTSITTINFGDNCNINISQSGFEGCSNLQTINFGNAQIKGIGNSAFKGCANLLAMNLENLQITSIGNSAFEGCTNLASVTLPDCLKTIGNYAFKNCKLTSINIPLGLESIDMTAFTGCNLSTVDWNANIDVPGNAFSGKTSLTTINFGDNCNIDILQSAFEGCTYLQTVNFGNAQIDTIGNRAFNGCSSLTMNFENLPITSIGDFAFEGCTSLTSAILPEGLTSIGSVAFRNCTSLKSVRMPSSLINFNTNAFTGVSIEYLEWNSNAVSPYFQGQENLKEVVFGNKSDIAISSQAFYKCKKLSSVDLGDHISSIGTDAFRETKIEEIAIPSTVSSIGDYAFRDCSALNSITFEPTAVPSLGSYGFLNGPADRKYYIPCGSYSSYIGATNTPCNASNTIEKCGEAQPYNITTLALDHNIECNSAKITRNNYTSNTAISFGGDYSLTANTLSIDWTFDAKNFYYFTLPFDCRVDSIVLDNKTIESKYFTCSWSEACNNTTYDNGGWQIVKYDENKFVNGKSGNAAYTAVQGNETLKAGVGYAFCLLNPTSDQTGATTVVATFTKNGKYSFNMNDGVTAPSNYTAEGGDNTKRGSNLYGNPFYWNIPLSNYGATSGVNVIFPNNTTGRPEFTTKLPDEALLPYEMAFIQRADNSNITISATPAVTTSNAPARYSNQRPIRLTLSHNGTKDDHIFIKSDVEASDKYVIGEDCFKMKNEGKNQIYTMVNDTVETAFNCLNLEGNVRTIPVGFTIVNNGSFQFAVADGTNFMPGTVLKLRDTQTSAEYNLLNGPATLTLNKGIINDRYILEVMDIPCGDEIISEVSNISAFVRDGRLIMDGVDANATVSVYDAAGRIVTSFTATSDVVSLDLEVRGVYFVSVNGQTIKIVY